MKAFLLVSLFCLQGFAGTVSVEGQASESDYCQGDSFADFCIINIQRRAQAKAEQNAQFSCRMKDGTIVAGSAFCSNFCNPTYVPPKFTTLVTCNSTCRMNCNIP